MIHPEHRVYRALFGSQQLVHPISPAAAVLQASSYAINLVQLSVTQNINRPTDLLSRRV